MGTGAVLAVSLASFANQDSALRNSLQILQQELAAGNLENAQPALSRYTRQLAMIGMRNPALENAGRAIPVNVQGLQNALATGDLAAAQNLALSIRQGSRKHQPQQSQESSSIENTEQIEEVSQAETAVALQAGAALEANRAILDTCA
jgi:hypothetical protein